MNIEWLSIETQILKPNNTSLLTCSNCAMLLIFLMYLHIYETRYSKALFPLLQYLMISNPSTKNTTYKKIFKTTQVLVWGESRKQPKINNKAVL